MKRMKKRAGEAQTDNEERSEVIRTANFSSTMPTQSIMTTTATATQVLPSSAASLSVATNSATKPGNTSASSLEASSLESATNPLARAGAKTKALPISDIGICWIELSRLLREFHSPVLERYDMAPLMAELDALSTDLGENEGADEDSWSFRPGEQRERDFRVGAAGELFVSAGLFGSSISRQHRLHSQVFKLLTRLSDHLPALA